MKAELERAGERVEIEAIGRQVFVSEGVESRREGFFDDAAAEAAAAEMVAARLADGWRESSAMVARRESLAAGARAAAARAARFAALAAAPDAAAALRAELAPVLAETARAAELLERLLSRVTGIDEPSSNGCRVDLGGGASLTFTAPIVPSGAPAALAAVLDRIDQLWLYLEPGDDHNLFFGAEGGPPEPEYELGNTPFAGEDVVWFLQELPWDRYWFLRANGARCYEFDGGLHDELHTEAIGELLLARILELLDRTP